MKTTEELRAMGYSPFRVETNGTRVYVRDGIDPGSLRFLFLHPDGSESTGSGIKATREEIDRMATLFSPFEVKPPPETKTQAIKEKVRPPKPASFWMALVSAALLTLALIPGWPYGYFTLLRFAVCGSSAAIAFWASEKRVPWMMWTHVVVAVLFNPFVKVHFPRELWAAIDAVVAVLMVVTARLIAKTGKSD